MVLFKRSSIALSVFFFFSLKDAEARIFGSLFLHSWVMKISHGVDFLIFPSSPFNSKHIHLEKFTESICLASCTVKNGFSRNLSDTS